MQSEKRQCTVFTFYCTVNKTNFLTGIASVYVILISMYLKNNYIFIIIISNLIHLIGNF